MSEAESIRSALDDIARALSDPDADYTEQEKIEIAALQEQLKARLKLTEKVEVGVRNA